jgi:plasmid replication initiation protein
MYEVLEIKAKQSESYKNKNLLEFEYDLQDFKELLLGEYNLKTGKIDIPKSYDRFNNFKARVLDMAYKELKEKGDYFFEYEPIKVRKKVQSLKFKIFKNGEKIKKDFHEKKKLLLQNSTTKALAQEQIRRIIERKKDTIKDKLKYEQKLFQLYLKGELKFNRDIQGVIDNMGV